MPSLLHTFYLIQSSSPFGWFECESDNTLGFTLVSFTNANLIVSLCLVGILKGLNLTLCAMLQFVLSSIVCGKTMIIKSKTLIEIVAAHIMCIFTAIKINGRGIVFSDYC
jgi:hypothetical protein